MSASSAVLQGQLADAQDAVAAVKAALEVRGVTLRAVALCWLRCLAACCAAEGVLINRLTPCQTARLTPCLRLCLIWGLPDLGVA